MQPRKEKSLLGTYFFFSYVILLVFPMPQFPHLENAEMLAGIGHLSFSQNYLD